MSDVTGLRPQRAVLLFFGVVWMAALSAGCASTSTIRLPDDPGSVLTNYRQFEPAVGPCRRVRTMEVALAINSRTGESRLRGNVLAALARPSSLRLIGVAPFGAAAFHLVAGAEDALLVLPRDRRYVRAASADALLGALAGLRLGPADLLAVLTGCLVPSPRAEGGRRYAGGWIGLDLEGGATLFLETVDGTEVIVAGRRPGIHVEYFDHVRGLPRRLHVVTQGADGAVTDLTARLSRVSINIDLHPDVFLAEVEDGYAPLTLDEFTGMPRPLEVPHSPEPSPSSSTSSLTP